MQKSLRYVGIALMFLVCCLCSVKLSAMEARSRGGETTRLQASATEERATCCAEFREDMSGAQSTC